MKLYNANNEIVMLKNQQLTTTSTTSSTNNNNGINMNKENENICTSKQLSLYTTKISNNFSIFLRVNRNLIKIFSFGIK